MQSVLSVCLCAIYAILILASTQPQLDNVAMECMPISILIQVLVVLAHKEPDHMGLEVDMARVAMVLTLAQVCFLCSLLEIESSIFVYVLLSHVFLPAQIAC